MFDDWVENGKGLHIWQCRIKETWDERLQQKILWASLEQIFIKCCVYQILFPKYEENWPFLCLFFFFFTPSCFVLVLYCILDKIWFIVTFQNFLWSWNVRYLKSWTTFNIKYCKLSSGYMRGQWCDFLLCEQNFDIVMALLQWWSCRQQFLMNSPIYPFI